MLRITGAIIGASLCVSACTMDMTGLDSPVVVTTRTAPGGVPVAAHRPASAPAAAATTTTTTTTTVRAPDGTTVTTTVSPTRAIGLRDLSGQWTATEPMGGNCRVTLSPDAFFGDRRASSTCLSGPLAQLESWQMRGSKVVLRSAFDGDIATLTLTEPRLLSGGGLSLWR